VPGITNTKDHHGLFVIAGALLIQLSLAAIYAWSVFPKPLQEPGWATARTQWPFTVGLLTFAVVMVFAARKLHTCAGRVST